eukprot:CFRG1961T1
MVNISVSCVPRCLIYSRIFICNTKCFFVTRLKALLTYTECSRLYSNMRSVSAVTHRALSLHCVLSRWGLEKTLRDRAATVDVQKIEQAAYNLLTAASNPTLQKSLTKKEKRLLTKNVGRWTAKDILRQDRKWETLGSLTWVLNRQHLEMPSFDTHFDRTSIFKIIGQPSSYNRFVDSVTEMRGEQEVLRMFEGAQLWHWRAHRAAMEAQVRVPTEKKRTAAKIELEGDYIVEPTLDDLPDIMETLRSHSSAAEGLVRVIDEDFSARGKPYRSHPPEVHASMAGIAQSRLYSLGWVLGVYDDWQD